MDVSMFVIRVGVADHADPSIMLDLEASPRLCQFSMSLGEVLKVENTFSRASAIFLKVHLCSK